MPAFESVHVPEDSNLVYGENSAHSAHGGLGYATSAKKPKGYEKRQVAAVEAMLDIADLDPNWDGDGAEPIGDEVLALSWSVLSQFLSVGYPPHEVSPTPNGTVSFEWDAQGVHTHLSIGKSLYSIYIIPKINTTLYFNKNLVGGVPSDVIEAVVASMKRQGE